MMTYIAYCRKSRLQEPEELTRQEHLVGDYCRKKGYILHRLFSEVGSSVDPDRPQYKLMLEYLTEHTGITIIVADYDRIGRDTLLLSLFKQLCKEHRHLVELINGTVYSYDNYTDIFTQEILSSVSSYIYQQTKAKMYRGLKQAQKEGKFIGAKLFGYNRENKRLVVNPIQSDIVKRVFKLVAQGTPTAEVARLLKQEGITTNTGKSFDTRAVRLMIQNEGYTGHKGDNVYPPIITRELYLEANQQLKSIPNCGNKRSYALSGKIFCKHCGIPLICGYKKDRDTVIVSKGMSKTCKCMSHRYDYIESLVKSDCLAFIECKLSELYQRLTDDKTVLAEHQKELVAIQSEIEVNSQKLEKLNDLYLLNNITAEDLKEKSIAVKDTITLLTLKRERVEGFSLYDRVQQIQDDIVKLEELQNKVNINDLVKLVDYVQYYKDTSGIKVNTVFK